jgi:hypothetical protein
MNAVANPIIHPRLHEAVVAVLMRFATIRAICSSCNAQPCSFGNYESVDMPNVKKNTILTGLFRPPLLYNVCPCARVRRAKSEML